MAIPFPPLLWPVRIGFSLENQSRSGGVSITGAEQVVVSDAGRWRAVATFNIVREERVLAWRAFLASLDGRAGEFEIGPFDRFRPANVNGRRVSNVDAATIGCGGLLHDLSAFGQTEQTYARLTSAAALGTTRITVEAVAPDGSAINAPWMIPRRGQYFGIGSRLCIATRSYRATEADPWTLDFRPRLRAAASLGDRVITDRPVSTMRLVSDDAGRLDLEFARYGQATLEMVEAV